MLRDRRKRSLQPGVRLWVRVDRARVFWRCRRGRPGYRRDGEEIFEYTCDTIGKLVAETTRHEFGGCFINRRREEVVGKGGQVGEFGEANIKGGNVRAVHLSTNAGKYCEDLRPRSV